MPKFYVLSGYVQEVIDAETSMDACVIAVRRNEWDENKMRYLMDFAVSERGLSHSDYDPECDEVLDLGLVLANAGWNMDEGDEITGWNRD